MTLEQLDEIEKLAEAQELPRAGSYALSLVKAVREARAALDEREGDMHARIRAGYDKTVADMWRAHCAKIEKERDDARAEVERLKADLAWVVGDPACDGKSSDPQDKPCNICFKCVTRQRDEARAEVERRTDWYQQRFNALRTWVKNEVNPLSPEIANRYFAIVANGSPSPHETADWGNTMHAANLRSYEFEARYREEAKAHAETKAEVERLRDAVRKVHALASEETAWETFPGMTAKYMREIHKITKGMVE